jgi:hypothetical protein
MELVKETVGGAELADVYNKVRAQKDRVKAGKKRHRKVQCGSMFLGIFPQYYLECSLNVPSMFPQRSLNVPRTLRTHALRRLLT